MRGETPGGVLQHAHGGQCNVFLAMHTGDMLLVSASGHWWEDGAAEVPMLDVFDQRLCSREQESKRTCRSA